MCTCRNWWFSTHSALTVFLSSVPRILRVSFQSPVRFSMKSSLKIRFGPSGGSSAATIRWCGAMAKDTSKIPARNHHRMTVTPSTTSRRLDSIRFRDIRHAHQLQTSEGIVHRTARELLVTVLEEGLEARPVQIGEHVAVADRLVAAGQVADHLDDVEPARLDVRAFHHDVGQAQ